jgi:hypothetical protein
MCGVAICWMNWKHTTEKRLGYVHKNWSHNLVHSVFEDSLRIDGLIISIPQHDLCD